MRLPNELSSQSAQVSMVTGYPVGGQEIKPDSGLILLHDANGDGKKALYEPKDVNQDGSAFTADDTFNAEQWIRSHLETVKYNVGKTYFQVHELTPNVTLSASEAEVTVTNTKGYPKILQYGDEIDLHIKNGTEKTVIKAMAYGGDTWVSAIPNGAVVKVRIPYPLTEKIGVSVTGGSGVYEVAKSIVNTRYWTKFLSP